jgi:hypothetical protein
MGAAGRLASLKDKQSTKLLVSLGRVTIILGRRGFHSNVIPIGSAFDPISQALPRRYPTVRKGEKESMSVSNGSSALNSIDNSTALLSSTIIDFCGKVRNNDLSSLPEADRPFKIYFLAREKTWNSLHSLMLSWKTPASHT